MTSTRNAPRVLGPLSVEPTRNRAGWILWCQELGANSRCACSKATRHTTSAEQASVTLTSRKPMAVARDDADGGGAKVPVAVAQQQDGLEIFLLPEHRAKRAAQVGADLPRLAKRVRHGQIRRRGECPDQHLGAGLERLPERALVLRINPGSPGDDVVRADDVARLHASRSVAKNRDLRRFGALNAPDKLRSQQRERQHRHRHESNDLEQGDFAATAIALPVAPAQPGGQRHHADPGKDDHHRGCKRPVTHAAAGWGLGGTASAIEPGRMSHASTTSASSIRNRNRRQISPCNAVSSRCA